MFPGHHLRILLLLAITTAVRAFTWADGGYSQHRQKYYNEAEYEDTEDYYYDYEEEFQPSDRLAYEPRFETSYGQPEERRVKHRPHHLHHPQPRYSTPAPLVFLAPLAGIAALYAMAYVNSNPTLLSLVTISGRRKRSLSLKDRLGVGEVEDMDYLNEVNVLSKFMSANPSLDLSDQRDLVMSSVLQCSSIGSSQCLDSLVCEFSREQSSYTEVEKDTITMVLYHLLASSHLPEEVKSRIRVAAGLGKRDHCHIFSCQLNLPEPSLT